MENPSSPVVEVDTHQFQGLCDQYVDPHWIKGIDTKSHQQALNKVFLHENPILNQLKIELFWWVDTERLL